MEGAVPQGARDDAHVMAGAEKGSQGREVWRAGRSDADSSADGEERSGIGVERMHSGGPSRLLGFFPTHRPPGKPRIA